METFDDASVAAVKNTFDQYGLNQAFIRFFNLKLAEKDATIVEKDKELERANKEIERAKQEREQLLPNGEGKRKIVNHSK